MATFKVQIEDLIGSVGDDNALTQWLQDGTREIINVLPSNLKETCYSKQTFTSVAANSEAETMVTGQLGSIFAGSVECRKIRPMDKHKASDSTSLQYATVTDPVYYVEGGKINILPVSLSGVYYVISNPSVAHGDSAITNFPNEAEYLVVLYSSIKGLQRLQNNLASNSAIDTTAFGAVATELSETQPLCDTMHTQINSAVSEIAEAATQVDSSVDTALAAIVTAAGRINTAVILANAEYDKCDALLTLGETDSEGAVNTALGLMVTEIGECDDIADNMHTEIGDALTEIGEAIALTDATSSDIKTALDGIQTALGKYRADNSDPALFGDDSTYATSDSMMTRVKDALDNAQNMIDNGAGVSGGAATHDAVSLLVTEEDVELVNGALSIVGAEINRAQAHIAEWNTTVQTLQSEISGFSSEASARYSWIGAKAQVWGAELSVAGAYGSEISSKLAIAQGHSNEINTRLAQARNKREESAARIASGNSYLAEAGASAQEAQTYASEVSARISQIGGYSQVASGYINTANGYAAQIQTKIGIAQGHIAEVSSRMQRDEQKFKWYQSQQAKLEQDYNKGIQILASKGLPAPAEGEGR